MRSKLIGFIAAFIWAALATSAYAQNAQINGAVKDSSGAIIPGATVTARNLDTGLLRTAVTDAQNAINAYGSQLKAIYSQWSSPDTGVIPLLKSKNLGPGSPNPVILASSSPT